MPNVKEWMLKLLTDAAGEKYCRNCELCYMREDQENGYCKLSRPDSPPEIPLVVNEFHICEHWKPKKPKDRPTKDVDGSPPKET